MADGDRHLELIGQGLELDLPETEPRAIAATAVCCDEHAARIGEPGRPHRVPPSPYGRDRERTGVMIDADAYPCLIVRKIVNAVGIRAPELGVHEVVNPHWLRGPTLREVAAWCASRG